MQKSDADDILTTITKHKKTPLNISDSKKEDKIKNILSCLELNKNQLSVLADLFSDLLKKGLLYNGTSPFNMQNTFVYHPLEGNESGSYLALDLGGTNFRVLLVELLHGQIVREEVKAYDMSDHLRRSTGEELFSYIAKSLADFVSKYGVSQEKIPLGFTFSFPTEQTALDSACLQLWIGKYNVPGVVGKDVVKLLNEEISKISGLNVPVVAVLNDTLGVLIKGTLIDKDTGISLILGTGSNACYFERSDCITGWEGNEKEVILNIEWGPFTDNGRGDIIKTKYDELIDDGSLHPKTFTFEKYVGGEFFGKLVRAILLDLSSQGLIFKGELNGVLKDLESFTSSYISEIEEDNLRNSTENTRRVLQKELGIDHCSDDDIAVLKHICELVSIRLALLTSVALSEIVKRMNRKSVTVACDGSLYKFHPRLKHYITDFTSALVNYKTEIKLILAEDGSGVGAALVAALACKQKKNKK